MQKIIRVALPAVAWLSLLAMVAVASVLAGLAETGRYRILNAVPGIPTVAMLFPIFWAITGEAQAGLLARLRPPSGVAADRLEELQRRDSRQRFGGTDRLGKERGVVVLAPPLSRPVVVISAATLFSVPPEEILGTLRPLLESRRQGILVRLASLWLFGVLLLGIPQLVGVSGDDVPALSFLIGLLVWPLMNQLVRPDTDWRGEPASRTSWPFMFGPEFWRVL